ncbi:MAG TPA: RecQ family ATP-dependent DNA helicase [Ktedonobacterales bacterium]|nr:RecQ family ATP-dependent DNA helicase [Ktedonobacterales bacterium]
MTPIAEPLTALLADLTGPDGTTSEEIFNALPIALATSLGLFLARCDVPPARTLARRLYDRLRPLAGESVGMSDSVARLALALDLPAEAETLLRARLDVSESLTAYGWLARAYLAQDRAADAHALAQRLREERGDRVSVWQMAGEVALAVGNLDEAESCYQRARALASGGTSALLGLARCAAARGDPDTAHEMVAQVFAAYSDAPSAWVLDDTLDVAARLGDNEWLEELRERQNRQRAREAESLRTMVAGALHPSTTDTETTGLRGRGRFGAQRLASAAARALADAAGDAAAEDEIAPESATGIEEEPPAPELLEALRDSFGYESFLPGQSTIIQAVLRGEDVLALLPTGAGKSLCYQLPALLLPGTTVLISPLIALMKDQLDNLPAAVRARATLVNSLLERDELERRLADIADGRYKLVYAAPERLRQQSFLHALRRAGVARFVVDEAHCVSLWGHDFRPDYLFIAKALHALEADGAHIPVLALTATATREVREGIAQALDRELLTVNRGVFRPNLRYEVLHVTNNEDRLRALAQLVAETPGSGIIYVRSREGCEKVAEFLRSRCHVSALHYHAGMERTEREAAQNDFIAGRVRIVAATVAFGMGIDKPDVRFIAHYQLPASLEAYVQESGRAGRDGKPSRCVLFASSADIAQVRRHIRQDELSIEALRAVYSAARGLVRAGAAPGSSVGRVGQSELEGAIGAALAAAEEREEVTETSARVALSLLERCGFLRRQLDVPRAPAVRLGTEMPGDTSEEAAFRAFITAAGLQPYQLAALDLVELAARLHLSPAEMEERLLSWRDAGLIEYREGARDLLIEICPAPADGKTKLPELLAALGERHERQIASLVAYTRATICRQRVMARHFGEQMPVAACGGCDRCDPGSFRTPERKTVTGKSPRRPRLERIRDDDEVRATILACLRAVPYEVGISGLVRILRGSADTGLAAQRLETYGALAAESQTRLKREIQALVDAGTLERDGSAEYPMLRVRSLPE